MTRRLSDTTPTGAGLNEADRRLWRRVARTVRAAPGRGSLDDPPEAPDPPTTLIARRSKVAPGSQPATAAPPQGGWTPPPAAPADVSGQKRVRRGQVEIDARIDLHGFTQDAAKAALTAFLTREQAAGARCVLVITGKGKAGTGVLRARLQDWLVDPEVRPLIAGQSRAHVRHGGEGAVYVLLKQRRARLSHG